MTRYLQEKFSVNYGGSEDYRKNWDTIFKPKTVPGATIEWTPEMREILKELIATADLPSSNPPQVEPPPVVRSGIRAQVEQFHRAFGLPVATRPTQPSDERVRLRLKLITEEYLELLESTGAVNPILKEELLSFCNSFDSNTHPYDKVDMVEFADACADLDYVVEGARLEFGINGLPIAAEVHRSNMSKLVDGKPVYREDGKVAKPATYSPADVTAELLAQGWPG